MKKKITAVILAAAIGAAGLMAVPYVAFSQSENAGTPAAQQSIQPNAALTFVTEDQVLSIEAPSEAWSEVKDAQHWFTLTDGDDIITIEHLSNGENLPSVTVAGKEYEAVFQTFVSTRNEVFVINGSAAKRENLEGIMKSIGTIRILKFDTKTSLTAAPKEAVFGLQKVGESYVVTADTLNVREGYSTESRNLGSLNKGEEVYVNGIVLKDGADYGWSQIRFGNGTAYVSSKFLAKGKAPAPQPTKAPEAPTVTPAETPAEEGETGVRELKLYGQRGTEEFMNVFRSSDNESWTDVRGLVYEKKSNAIPVYYEKVNGKYWSSEKEWDLVKLYNKDGAELTTFRFGESSNTKDMNGVVYTRREGMAPVFTDPAGTVWSNVTEYWDEIREIEQETEETPAEPTAEPEAPAEEPAEPTQAPEEQTETPAYEEGETETEEMISEDDFVNIEGDTYEEDSWSDMPEADE